MAKPKRIQRKRTKGWRMPPNTIHVGRSSDWENVFKVGEDAYRFSFGMPHRFPQNIEEVLADYRYYCETWLILAPYWLKPLRGKDLACWCKTEDKCHADVLLELANE